MLVNKNLSFDERFNTYLGFREQFSHFTEEGQNYYANENTVLNDYIFRYNNYKDYQNNFSVDYAEVTGFDEDKIFFINDEGYIDDEGYWIGDIQIEHSENLVDEEEYEEHREDLDDCFWNYEDEDDKVLSIFDPYADKGYRYLDVEVDGELHRLKFVHNWFDVYKLKQD